MSETSIVLQLQELATDPNSNVENLLTKALVVARKLDIQEFRKWCELELEGYSGEEEVPAYRRIKGQLKVLNPVRGLIPFILPAELDEIVTNIDARQSIGDICNLINQNSGKIYFVFSGEMKQRLMEMQLHTVSSPMEPKLVFQPIQLMTILTNVKNIILRWSLQLEEDGILGEGLKFTEKEKAAVMSVNHYNIQNMQGVAGNISGGTVNQNNQMNIQKMNFDSLAKHLTDNNVAFSDIQALKEAIDNDPVPTEANKLGEKVSAWIGSMVGKAASGSWDISVATAGTLLAESIAKFYGIG
ncbi:hypothetical protein [Acinetobacter towneri]|uniref:AbiTii domain-containing protein n=1 Tax=Acinetobacter towneri TaxID=202956 RepID=UPI0034D5B6CC